jgi:hypothetical protein
VAVLVNGVRISRLLTVSDEITLEAMPKVRVPRKNVTPGEIVAVLSRRLGPDPSQPLTHHSL